MTFSLNPLPARHRGISLEILATLAFMLGTSLCLSATNTAPAGKADASPAGQMPYFDAVPDPLEGFNRCSFAVNDWLFRDVVYPASLGYTFAVPKPVRSSIDNERQNLAYPVRLVNSCLQGKWQGTWQETERFGINNTLGLGGIFDPAARFKIQPSNRDAGETLGHYGAGPGFYLVIPILGPSNARDAFGRVIDEPLDGSFWLGVAYPHDVWPYAIGPASDFNGLSGNAREYKRELDSFADPYVATRTLYSLNRQRLVLDYAPCGGTNDHPNPTIRAVLFKPITPNFADLAVTHKVVIPATGKKLAYSCWIQKKPAPLIIYLPGLGAYRYDRSTLAYADMLYRHGYSVAAISSPFQKEFMESASTVAVPGYGPTDCDDVVNALKLIVSDLRNRHHHQITGISLTGVSHGGYLTLMIAAREAAGQLGGLSFDRYVAVNPPPQLGFGAQRLDDMFNAPLAWPADQRQKHIKESIYKGLYFAENNLDISGDLPLTRSESDFLIGLSFRFTLMNVIEYSQRQNNLGVLKVNPNQFVRQDSIREIRQIGYCEYFDRFVLPCLIHTGRVADRAEALRQCDLMYNPEWLRNNLKIRVQICDDDFLLTPQDLSWFRSTFDDRLLEYSDGGHLGNLHRPGVQEALVRLFH
jgi:phospholipid-binding lipoprotein MlaA